MACPNCGYCPACGRARTTPYYPWMYPNTWWGTSSPPYVNYSGTVYDVNHPGTITWNITSGDEEPPDAGVVV